MSEKTRTDAAVDVDAIFGTLGHALWIATPHASSYLCSTGRFDAEPRARERPTGGFALDQGGEDAIIRPPRGERIHRRTRPKHRSGRPGAARAER